MLIVYSALLGLFAEICYLLTSYLIDKTGKVSLAVSNFIGLMVDVILDFILQSLLFLGIIYPTNIYKFILFRIFDTILRQILYVYSQKIEFVQTYLKNETSPSKKSMIPKFLRHRQTHIRYIIIMLCFFIFTYPMRKYLIFTAPARI